MRSLRRPLAKREFAILIHQDFHRIARLELVAKGRKVPLFAHQAIPTPIPFKPDNNSEKIAVLFNS